MAIIGRRRVSRHNNGKDTIQLLVHLPAEVVAKWEHVTHVDVAWSGKNVVLKPITEKK